MSDLLGFIGDVGSALLGSNSAKKPTKKTSVYNGSNRHGKNACQTPRCKDASRI